MGKGGALNAWLREFCALVFTQTLQAFIYAIIIVLVISTNNYVNQKVAENSYENFRNNTSMGIINIFALTSVFKIEELARKVFGIQRSSTQPESPMASMAKLAFMSHFGRRLWDNGKKLVKGGFGIAKAGRDKRKNRRKHLEADNKRSQAITKLEGEIQELENSTSTTEAANGMGNISGIGAKPKKGGEGTQGMSVSTLYINAGSVNMDGSGGQTDSEKLDKMKDRLNSLLEARDSAREAYDDKVSATSKQMQDSLHMMASGITETIGATLGGALGAVIGGADGKGLAQGTIVGMNLGDRVGQGVTDLGFSAKDLITEVKKDMKSRGKLKELELDAAEYDELIEAIKENQELDRKAVKDVIKQVKDSTEKKKKQLGRIHDTDTELNNM